MFGRIFDKKLLEKIVEGEDECFHMVLRGFLKRFSKKDGERNWEDNCLHSFSFELNNVIFNPKNSTWKLKVILRLRLILVKNYINQFNITLMLF